MTLYNGVYDQFLYSFCLSSLEHVPKVYIYLGGTNCAVDFLRCFLFVASLVFIIELAHLLENNFYLKLIFY